VTSSSKASTRRGSHSCAAGDPRERASDECSHARRHDAHQFAIELASRHGHNLSHDAPSPTTVPRPSRDVSDPPSFLTPTEGPRGKHNATKCVTEPSPLPSSVNQSEDEQQNGGADGRAEPPFLLLTPRALGHRLTDGLGAVHLRSPPTSTS